MIYFGFVEITISSFSAISVKSSQNDSTLTFKHSRKIWKLHVFLDFFTGINFLRVP